MSDTFPLLLKEGWPDHFLIMIQMLIPAGVVDCLFKFRIFPLKVFLISFFTNSGSWNTNLFSNLILRIQDFKILISFFRFFYFTIKVRRNQ